MKKQKKWTQEEADEALVRMQPALAYDYQGEDGVELRATFKNADLSGLNLRNAILTYANLDRAWIYGCNPL